MATSEVGGTRDLVEKGGLNFNKQLSGETAFNK
jgi:hypothetical protein